MIEYSKEEYENKINNSALFSINKKGNEDLYKAEKYNLLNLLYAYYIKYIYKCDVANNDFQYSKEFVENFDDVLKSYDISKGVFINYFNKALKNKLDKIKAIEKYGNKSSGIKTHNSHIKVISKIKKLVYISEKNNYDTEQLIRILAKKLDMSAAKIRQLLIEDKSTTSVSNIEIDSNGEEIDVFTKIPNNQNEQELIESNENIQIILRKIDDVFANQQKRNDTNKIISALLTIDILNEYASVIINLKEKYSFIDEDILNLYKQGKVLPTQREYAKLIHKNEASVSRTYKVFKDKLKTIIC